MSHKKSGMSRQARARWQRQYRAARGHRPWTYDPSAGDDGRGRYELHPEQLANLRIGMLLKAQAARKTRQRIAILHARGFPARDIVLLTGLGRATVYRWLRTLRDPLLL